MTDQTIRCPKCSTEFPLTASLAAPLVEATRREFENRLTTERTRIAEEEAAKAKTALGTELEGKQSEIANLQESLKQRNAKVAELQKQQTELSRQRQELEDARNELEVTVAEKLREERAKISAEAESKAKLALKDDLDARARQCAELEEQVASQRGKLQEAQKAQADLQKQKQELEDARNELDMTIAEKLRDERAKIAAEAEGKVKRALQDDMEARARQCAELEEQVASQRSKLQEAQKAQAELLKQKQELEDAKAQLQLDVQKGIREGLESARAQARQESENAANLKLAEAQITNESLKKQLEEMKRKLDQGSQQLQGEVLELALEASLRAQFPMDTIMPVPKGEFGGDTVQTVCGPLGQPCGTILWESKRTKTWSDGWLQKLKDDQRAAKAAVAVIVSEKLPKDVSTFHLLDGIWVTHWNCAIPVALCLRQSLIELSLARHTREGQETKMEAVYEYLTGPHFRQRIQAIVEAFTTMQDDLAKERRAIQSQWAKREKQLERVLLATAGMYGDLQGIAGQSVKEIEGLDFPLIEPADTYEE